MSRGQGPSRESLCFGALFGAKTSANPLTRKPSFRQKLKKLESTTLPSRCAATARSTTSCCNSASLSILFPHLSGLCCLLLSIPSFLPTVDLPSPASRPSRPTTLHFFCHLLPRLHPTLRAGASSFANHYYLYHLSLFFAVSSASQAALVRFSHPMR